jgi:hypothetical protein
MAKIYFIKAHPDFDDSFYTSARMRRARLRVGNNVKFLTMILCLAFAATACSDKKSKKADGSAPAVVDETTEESSTVPDKSVSMKFVTPADDTSKIVSGASYDIAVEFINTSATATWGIFYTPTQGSVAGGMAILEDLPVTLTKITWDTSFVDPGTYYVYVVLVNEGISNVYNAPGSFKFEGSLDLNRAPVATIASPDGDRSYAPGAMIPITFTAVDADDDPLDIKVEYTADGSLWQVIQDNVAADVNQIEWLIPTDAVRGARYRIRVVASDGKQTAEAINNKVFGINSTPVIYTAQVQNILNAKCAAACHEGVLPTANLNLTNFAGADIGKQGIVDRTRMTAESPMPPATDARKLTVEERDLLQLWLWGGAPQN